MNPQVAINNFLPSNSPRHGNPNPTFYFYFLQSHRRTITAGKWFLFPQETPAVATREWKSVSLAFTTCRAGYYVKFAIEILHSAEACRTLTNFFAKAIFCILSTVQFLQFSLHAIREFFFGKMKIIFPWLFSIFIFANITSALAVGCAARDSSLSFANLAWKDWIFFGCV